MVGRPGPPERLTPEVLVARYPRLYHMAEAESWPSIRRNGLLSTSALLDLFEVNVQERFALESLRRPKSEPIHHPKHGTAWIRDNIPIIETVLERTLDGMTPEEWYRTLNGRVFFWLSEKRLNRLRNAPAYRDRLHDILTVDTAALLDRYSDAVELAHLNSGATHPAANYPRGAGTFQPIDRYPWGERKRINPSEPVVELTVAYSVPDIRNFVVKVETR
jgi:hypothetical protein